MELSIEVIVTSIKDVAVRCLDPNFWNSCTAALRTSDSEPFVSALMKHMLKIAEQHYKYEANLPASPCSGNPHFDSLSTPTDVFGLQSSPEDSDGSAACGSASSQSSSGLSDTQQSQGSQTSSSLSPPEAGSSDFDDLLDLM